MKDETLKRTRKRIDALDEELLRVLSKRFEIVREIRDLKKATGLPPLDPKRWDEVVEARLTLAKELWLPQGFTKQFLDLIHKRSLEIEN